MASSPYRTEKTTNLTVVSRLRQYAYIPPVTPQECIHLRDRGPNACHYIEYYGGEPAGVATLIREPYSFTHQKESNTKFFYPSPLWRLRNVTVAPHLRQKGVGRHLVAHVLGVKTEPVWASVRTPLLHTFYEPYLRGVLGEEYALPTGAHIDIIMNGGSLHE